VVFWSDPWCAKRLEPTGPASDNKQSPKNHMGNRSGKPLSVCCRHRALCLESTAVTSSSQNTASKHVQIVGIHSRDTVIMQICPFQIVGTSKSSRRGKLLPGLTKPFRMNLVEEHIVRIFVSLALGRTVSEIWGYNCCHAFQSGKICPQNHQAPRPPRDPG